MKTITTNGKEIGIISLPKDARAFEKVLSVKTQLPHRLYYETGDKGEYAIGQGVDVGFDFTVLGTYANNDICVESFRLSMLDLLEAKEDTNNAEPSFQSWVKSLGFTDFEKLIFIEKVK